MIMDDIEQRIQELSVESGYKLSKKVKRRNERRFVKFLSTVVDNEPPLYDFF